MMQVPLLTKEVANRVEQADHDVMRARVEAFARVPGNPRRASVGTFGSVSALCVPGIPGTDFTRVMGMTDETVGMLDELISFYEEQNIGTFALDVIPSACSEELLAALAARGFAQKSFHTALYGVPAGVHLQEDAPIEVRTAEREEAALFGELFARGMEIPIEFASALAADHQELFGQPGWTLYTASVAGVPAGFAMLHVRDGAACLAQAGVAPEFRRRGVQTQLLKRRILDAAAQGAQLLVSQASFGSQSLHNMQRIGLQVAYTKSVWVRQKS